MRGDDSKILIKITGMGSLQGSDAAEALVFALNDKALGDDTYAMAAFTVDDNGDSLQQA